MDRGAYMANRKRLLLLGILLFYASIFLYSQEEEESSDEAANTYIFLQHLDWEAAEFASHYELVVQQRQFTGYLEVIRRIVETPYADVSLPAGEYRYKVLAYNILGWLDTESDWESFIIIQALQPHISYFSPSNFYFDRQTLRIITLEGENLILDSEIYLQRRFSSPDDEDEGKLLPREIRRNELGDSAGLVFDEEDLVAGVYDIIVKNPGGLETTTGPFGISVLKPFDINVSVGYSPQFRIYGDTSYLVQSVFIPASFGARASFIPFKYDIGFFGAEVNTNWNYLSTEQRGFITKAHVVTFLFNGVYQYWLIRRVLAINGRAGLGFGLLLDYHFEFPTGKTGDSYNSAFFTAGFGGSAQWFVYQQLYLEAGIDYFHQAAPDMPMGIIRFMIGGGWQF